MQNKTKAIDFTKPLRTKTGHIVTLLSTEARGDYAVLGYIEDNSVISSWTKSGRFDVYEHSLYDLENIPEPRVAYVNCYDFGGGYAYESRARADATARPDRIACIKVEFVAGQYDD